MQVSIPCGEIAAGERWFPSFPYRASIFLVLLVASLCIQWGSGAYQAEFAEDADEPSHYVTGLLVRDYAAAGFPRNPMRFAEDYYLHYPKVGLGHWPPLFYALEALWMAIFGVSRASVLVFMAALVSVLGTMVAEVARNRFGRMAGAAAGLVLISLPLVAEASRMVMSDTLVAVFALGAALCYGRYLESGNWRHSAAFGLLAAAAVLTKGTALALALVPVAAVLLTRRWNLLMSWSFWLPALLVGALCAPWYLLAPDALQDSVMRYGGVRVRPFAMLRELPSSWVRTIGIALLAPMLIGLCERTAATWRRRADGTWVALVSLLFGVTVFRLFVVTARPQRHMVMAAAVFVLLGVAGAALLFRLPGAARLGWWRTGLAAGGAALLFAANIANAGSKPRLGMIEAARQALAAIDSEPGVVLVSSDAFGEGSFVAEAAMVDQRPGRYVLRASKVLCEISWMADRYRQLYHSPAEVAAVLDDTATSAVVVDLSPSSRWPHHALLRETLLADPQVWKRVEAKGAAAAPVLRNVEIYVRRGPFADTGNLRERLRRRITHR